MSKTEVFIGAKVLADDGEGRKGIGLVFSHDGAYAGGYPWRVAVMDSDGRFSDYHYYDSPRLTVLGDFGECLDDQHPLNGFWEFYFSGCYKWDSFVSVYNDLCGSGHNLLEGSDSMDMLEEV